MENEGVSDARSRIKYVKNGHVATVTLNRPEVLNAMDRQTHAELAEVWDDVEADDTIRVAVLTGAGDRAFSVGQDLKELAERHRTGESTIASFGSRGQPGWPRLTERFDMTTPVVAKVRGHAVGGGFELAMACDLVVAETGARFALPEARLGLIAGAGGVFRLTKQAPFRVALGHLITGRPMSAARAYELGLINEVVPADELDDCVAGWVTDIVRCAPLAVRAVKEVATTALTLSLPEAFERRYRWEERRMVSDDAHEGARAFAERREPRWTGR